MYKYLLIFVLTEQLVQAQYTVRIVKFEACKGPKRKNCTIVSLSSPNEYTVHFDITVKQNVTLTYGKVTGKTLKDKRELPFQMKKPCDNFMIRKSMETFLKITNDCVILKNRYVFSINLKDYTNINPYIAEYVQGEWIYQSLFYAKDCNVLCSYLHVKVERETPH